MALCLSLPRAPWAHALAALALSACGGASPAPTAPSPTPVAETAATTAEEGEGDDVDPADCDYAFYVAQVEAARDAPPRDPDGEGAIDITSVYGAIEAVENTMLMLSEWEGFDAVRDACRAPVAPEHRVSSLLERLDELHDRLMASAEESDDAGDPGLDDVTRREVSTLQSAPVDVLSRALRDREAVLRHLTEDRCSVMRVLEVQWWRDLMSEMEREAAELYRGPSESGMVHASRLRLAAAEARSVGLDVMDEASTAVPELDGSAALRRELGVTFEETRARLERVTAECPGEIDPSLYLPSFRSDAGP